MKDSKSSKEVEIEQPNRFPVSRYGPLLKSKKQAEEVAKAIKEEQEPEVVPPTNPLDDYFNT